MGTILASEIIGKARVILMDVTPVRWLDPELLGWVNDGQREICAIFPEVNAVMANITLVAGTKQALPAGATTLMRISRNMGVSGTAVGNAVRQVGHDILDSQLPGWHALAAVTDIKHYIYDPRNPRAFYVYPPSVVSNQLEALYTTAPADLPNTGTAISVDDTYHNPLLDYVCYRAFNKDLELAGATSGAAEHYSKFKDFMEANAIVKKNDGPANMDRESA